MGTLLGWVDHRQNQTVTAGFEGNKKRRLSL
jgi:hypothetical protein